MQEIAACSSLFANKSTSEQRRVAYRPRLRQCRRFQTLYAHTTPIARSHAASRSGKRSEPCNLSPSFDGFTLMWNVA